MARLLRSAAARRRVRLLRRRAVRQARVAQPEPHQDAERAAVADRAGAAPRARTAAHPGRRDRQPHAVGAQARGDAAAGLRAGAPSRSATCRSSKSCLQPPWDASGRSRHRAASSVMCRLARAVAARIERSSQLGIEGEQSERLLAHLPALRRATLLERQTPRRTTSTPRCSSGTASRSSGRTTRTRSIRSSTATSCRTCRRSICCSIAATSTAVARRACASDQERERIA